MKSENRRDPARGIFNEREPKSEEEIYLNRTLLKMMIERLKSQNAKASADKDGKLIS